MKLLQKSRKKDKKQIQFRETYGKETNSSWSLKNTHNLNRQKKEQKSFRKKEPYEQRYDIKNRYTG